MKTLILAVALTLGSSTVIADDSKSDLCKDIHGLAHQIMVNRQAEISMALMMEPTKGNKLFQEIVKAAYSVPAYHAESNQRKAADQFANNAYIACIEEL